MNPGSREARDAGCTCPQYENACGQGNPEWWPGGDPTRVHFIVAPQCPICVTQKADTFAAAARALSGRKGQG